VDLPDLERGVLELWDRIGAFPRSVEMRPPESEYSFYDGPPFPTGSPHYGNLLAGVIKDIVPRYWTMRGHRVVRRFGWDTHGLPVEMEVERALGLSGPKDIADYGIERFNAACRRVVQANTETWESLTRRLGRWVDFDDDYKTMDPEFMESVWWVFRQLWDRGLVYRDVKVLPYSWGAATPLSNFEANLDYRQIDDPAITVRLQVVSGKGPVADGDWLLIWTTTPWTLPGNLAVAVGEDITYLCVAADGERYWVAESRLDSIWPQPRPSVRVVQHALGADLLGTEYQPPFDWFGEERDRGAFRVIPADEVTTDEGTGLVHMAPAYGEADFVALQAAGLDVLVDPVDAEGRFTDAIPPLAGTRVKDADVELIERLKVAGLLYRRGQIRHSYPYCYRTGTPLIYKAIPTWFVRVEAFRDRMVEANRRIHWVPEHVGARRFGNWLEDARDWAISRNRYWGSCIPVWQCDRGGHQVCVGSIDQLAELSGVRLDDLHREYVDPVSFACADCAGTMRRVPEVLDCWFESGSMPYGQLHYPFENQERFERAFPAHFIAEGLDQTRGWFYTLLVLSTAIFDTEPFRNCVVNGLILAEDGRKMSKSLKNYPDPNGIFDEFGADALRAYLINSPVLRAEPFRFSRDGVREVVRTVLLPLWNAFSFYTTYAEADGISASDLAAAPPVEDRPELDRWVLSVLQSQVAEVNRQMEGYYLYAVIPPVLGFIDDLTNWYVRRARRRFWRSRGDDEGDKLAAFATMHEVLVTFAKVLAPVLPFVTEEIHQALVVAPQGEDQPPTSIHHADYPVADPTLIDVDLELAMESVRAITRLSHALRKQHGVKVRQPLRAVTVLTRSSEVEKAVRSHVELIRDEINVRDVVVRHDESSLVDLSVRPDYRTLGPRLGSRVSDVAAELASISGADVERLQHGERLTVSGVEIGIDDVVVQRVPRPGTVVASEGELSVALDLDLDEDLVAEGLAREVVSRVQQLRREAGLEVTTRIRLAWSTPDADLRSAIESHRDFIAAEVLAVETTENGTTDKKTEVNGAPLSIGIEAVA
jgi:isoleucyl-tRNA synthetase